MWKKPQQHNPPKVPCLRDPNAYHPVPPPPNDLISALTLLPIPSAHSLLRLQPSLTSQKPGLPLSHTPPVNLWPQSQLHPLPPLCLAQLPKICLVLLGSHSFRLLSFAVPSGPESQPCSGIPSGLQLFSQRRQEGGQILPIPHRIPPHHPSTSFLIFNFKIKSGSL